MSEHGGGQIKHVYQVNLVCWLQLWVKLHALRFLSVPASKDKKLHVPSRGLGDVGREKILILVRR